MKQKSETNRQNPSEKYCSPTAKAIMVNVTRVLCGSERENALNTTEMMEGDDNW